MLSEYILPDSETAPYFESGLFLHGNTNKALHAFFGRRGGVSKNVYNSLNVGFGSDD